MPPMATARRVADHARRWPRRARRTPRGGSDGQHNARIDPIASAAPAPIRQARAGRAAVGGGAGLTPRLRGRARSTSRATLAPNSRSARARSWRAWQSSQKRAPVPSQRPSRSAVSAETPRRPSSPPAAGRGGQGPSARQGARDRRAAALSASAWGFSPPPTALARRALRAARDAWRSASLHGMAFFARARGAHAGEGRRAQSLSTAPAWPSTPHRTRRPPNDACTVSASARNARPRVARRGACQRAARRTRGRRAGQGKASQSKELALSSF